MAEDDKEQQSEDTVTTSADTAAETVIAPDAAETKLKLAEPAAEQSEDGGRGAEDAGGLIGTDTPEVPPRKQPSSGFGIGVVNKFLMVVVLVILSFAVFETWSSVTAMQDPELPSTDIVMPHIEQDVNLPTLAELLRAFSDKPLLQGVDQRPPDPGPQTGPSPAVGWRKAVADHWNVIGVSKDASGVLEAILVDKSANRMHFLRPGSEVDVSGKTITVEKIGGEEVILSDGRNSVTIQ